MSDIKIYVADLAAYNNGKLHGVWIDATLDIEEIQEAIAEMLKKSPEGFAEEYAIHDYEGFASYRLSEYQGLQSIHDIALLIEEHGDLGAELLSYYDDLEEVQAKLKDDYRGCYSSLADFAADITEEGEAEIPEPLKIYIDYERMGRDMEMSGDIFTIELGFEKVHVFWNR